MNSAARLAMIDMAHEFKVLACDKYFVSPTSVFTKKQRALNRELGLSKINKQWKL